MASFVTLSLGKEHEEHRRLGIRDFLAILGLRSSAHVGGNRLEVFVRQGKCRNQGNPGYVERELVEEQVRTIAPAHVQSLLSMGKQFRVRVTRRARSASRRQLGVV